MPIKYHRMSAFVVVLLLLSFLPTAITSAAPAIAPTFRDYYVEHQGWRVLGAPLSTMLQVNGHNAQYFEKGRIEDHRDGATDSAWAFMYGRLTAELTARAPQQTANATSSTYGDLERAAAPELRRSAPSAFTGGTVAVQDGIFIPYDPQLRPAPGYVVPLYFWTYINRTDLFPGGWLHDIGLPMTGALMVTTVKDGESRPIMLQAFERTVLTYDPQNPQEWQVERGNIGADMMQMAAGAGTIEMPAAGSRVTLPLHVIAHAGQPGEQMTVTLRWKNGVTLSHTATALDDTYGNGVVITNLDWLRESRPPQPAARSAILEIRDAMGVIQAQHEVNVLRWDDQAAQPVSLYWLLGNDVHRTQRQVPQTVQIGTATLKELLWGPRPGSLAGFTTAIPSPKEVLAYPGRTVAWGPRVTLRSLTIDDGLATADFSRELLAYGGDQMRAEQIATQITRTLHQFPTVSQVRITVEGEVVPALQP